MTVGSHVRGGVALALLLVHPCACSRGHESAAPCPRHEAAFRVQLTAVGASLPLDTRIQVDYQGSQTESFALAMPGRNEDVCCRVGAPVTGALPHVPCGAASAPGDAGGIAHAGAAVNGADAARGLDAGGLVEAGSADGAGSDGAASDAASASRDAGRSDTALLCELWTNGPASVHVTATGYGTIDEDLESKLRDDKCGVRTVDVRIVLHRPDGG